MGPVKWTYFYLYVILDVFSRYVTGWMVAHREGAELAKQFIEETLRKHQVPRSTQHPCRLRQGDDLQAGRLSDGRPGRHQNAQPTLRIRR